MSSFDEDKYCQTHRTGNGLLPVDKALVSESQYQELIVHYWHDKMTLDQKYVCARNQAQLLHTFRLFETVHWLWLGGGLLEHFVLPGNKLIQWGIDASPPVKFFNTILGNQLTAPVLELSTSVTKIDFSEKALENSTTLKAYKNWNKGEHLYHWNPQFPESHLMNSKFIPKMDTDNRNQKEKFGFYKEEDVAFEQAIDLHTKCSSKSDKLDVRHQNEWKGVVTKGDEMFNQNFSATLKATSHMTLEQPHPMGKSFASATKRLVQSSQNDFAPETQTFTKLTTRYLAELLAHSHLLLNYIFLELDPESDFFVKNPERKKRFDFLRIGQTANLLASDKVFDIINDIFKANSKFKLSGNPTQAEFFKVINDLSMLFNISGVTSLKRTEFIKMIPKKFKEMDKMYQEMFPQISAFKKRMKSNQISTPGDKHSQQGTKRSREEASVPNKRNNFAQRPRGTRGRGGARGRRGGRRGRGAYRGRWENDWNNPSSKNFRPKSAEIVK